MEFKIEKTANENIYHYPTEDLGIANEFAKKLKRELADFLVSVVVFGSTARREKKEKSDIDLLVITDDINFRLTEPLVETYRIIVEKTIQETSEKLHVTSMTLTSFWEYVKAADPVAINILRDGFPLLDPGIFVPLQQLLKQGRIRPTEESVWRYFGRSPRTLLNSRWHLLQATLDLYWAVIDAGHSALMKFNIIPPTPEHLADLLEKEIVSKGLLEKKYAETVRRFYKLFKMITHREIQKITGDEYENYIKEASEFVYRIKKLLMEK